MPTTHESPYASNLHHRLLADPSSNCIALSFEADEEGEPDPQQQKLSFGPAAGAKEARTNTANTAQGAGGIGKAAGGRHRFISPDKGG